MIVKKITVGFVIQDYDTETEKFVSQEFIAGDQVDWEDEEGTNLDPDDFVVKGDGTLPYLPFEMVQPEVEDIIQEAPTVDQEVEDRRIK
jgi:hypothetical protein